jgi:putative multiple sugar transport system substrate-binding protein
MLKRASAYTKREKIFLSYSKMKKVVSFAILLVVFASMLSLLSGCSIGNQNKLIGVSMPSKVQQRWTQDGDNIKKQLQAKGYKVELRNAEDDIEKQIAQIQELIDKDCIIIVISAIDGEGLTEVLKNAAKKKITVISYDRLIANTPTMDYYLTFDNVEVGAMQAEYIVNAFDLKEGGNTITMEMFSGALDDSCTPDYYEGQMSVLRPYIDNGQIIIKSSQSSLDKTATFDWSGDVAAERLDKILKQYYNDGTRLDAVLSTYDGMSIAMIEILKTAGYKTPENPLPVMTGQDCDKASVISIINGEQSMSVFVDTRTLAARTVDMIDDIMVGKKPVINDSSRYNNGVKDVPAAICKPVFVDKENYREVLIDSGYYKESDLK